MRTIVVVCVVGHRVEVQVAVGVIIAPRGARPVALSPHASRCGHIGKLPFSLSKLIPIQSISLLRGLSGLGVDGVIDHVEIGVTIVVIVGEHRADALSGWIGDVPSRSLIREGTGSRLIHPELSRLASQGDVEIEVPVPVDVAPCGPR